MIDVALETKDKRPLYEQLYLGIRMAIESGGLKAGVKLPSKRKMADHLQVSLRTVENAYAQLTLEGYIGGIEKKAYYVQLVERPRPDRSVRPESRTPTAPPDADCLYDLKTNRINKQNFPVSIWAKLMRQCLREESEVLLEPVHPQGDLSLRREIVNYLREFRSMKVEADQIIVGAGTEYLLGLITELLRGRVFAIEEPNYHKPALIFKSRGVEFVPIDLDREGLCVDILGESKATAALVTPSHHFPLGTVMSINRRLRLLGWAAQKKERYLIEDDYDSEYRFNLKPVPPLHSLDRHDKVIYMNTFTRTLAPSLRIAYLVLPPPLLERYRRGLMFYACTVSEIEQRTLARLMGEGYYERHLSRIRTAYRMRRDALLGELESISGQISIRGQEAGLHLLLTATGRLSEEEMIRRALREGVRVYGLSAFYRNKVKRSSTVIAGYAGYDIPDLRLAAGLLIKAWRGK